MSEPSHRGEQPRRVLFVCVENSCRSQMAEAFARKLGAGQVEAYSAGTCPSDRVHPLAATLMREADCDLGRHRPKGLAEVPGVEFDAVVTMGCGDVSAYLRARRREGWAVAAPKAMPPEQFRAVRDFIKEKVEPLLATLQGAGAGT